MLQKIVVVDFLPLIQYHHFLKRLKKMKLSLEPNIIGFKAQYQRFNMLKCLLNNGSNLSPLVYISNELFIV